MTNKYQAVFSSDFSVLSFLAENQKEALDIVNRHAMEGEEFELKVENSTKSSYWRMGYGLEPCKRVK